MQLKAKTMKRLKRTKLSLKALLLSTILFLFSEIKLFAQTDTIVLYIRGEFSKSDQFALKFNGEIIGKFGFKNEKLELKIAVDKTKQEEYRPLGLKLLKLNKSKTYLPVDVLFIYDPRSQYIHIYHPKMDKPELFSIFYLPVKKSIFVED
jgi:hypothetical protein